MILINRSSLFSAILVPACRVLVHVVPYYASDTSFVFCAIDSRCDEFNAEVNATTFRASSYDILFKTVVLLLSGQTGDRPNETELHLSKKCTEIDATVEFLSNRNLLH